MEHLHARNVVLGAGAMGVAAAYHLARRGEPVWLVEQFALGHTRGSSHGAARITRHSYADVRYARVMPEAFRAWRELEADAGRNLFLRTGGLSISPAGADYVEQVSASLMEVGVPFRRMTGGQLNRTLPVFGVAEDADVVFEPDAGMIAASLALRVQVELAREIGGEETRVLEGVKVSRVDLSGARPTLVMDGGTIEADRLIVTAGTWTGMLFPKWPVPMTPTRQRVLYFRPPDPVVYEPGGLPVFIFKGAGDLDAFYGMPAFRGLGVKVARHGGPAADPEVEAGGAEVDEEYRSLVRDFLGDCLPGLAGAAIDHEEVCLYNVAPAEAFQFGRPGGRDDVMVGSPCSGHGFKFSCLIGKHLAHWAATGEWGWPSKLSGE